MLGHTEDPSGAEASRQRTRHCTSRAYAQQPRRQPHQRGNTRRPWAAMRLGLRPHKLADTSANSLLKLGSLLATVCPRIKMRGTSLRSTVSLVFLLAVREREASHVNGLNARQDTHVSSLIRCMVVHGHAGTTELWMPRSESPGQDAVTVYSELKTWPIS